MKEAEAIRFQKQLEEEPFVKQATYISKAQALKEQTEAMGTDPAEFLGYNPFTASIEIKLNAAYANSDSLSWIQEKLGLAALLTLISFALINNTIRLTIYSKRFLIHTMKLVGASWSFIRRPFIVRNVWIGILAAAMANALLISMSYMLVNYEPGLLELITPEVMLCVMGAVFISGILIATLCAYISINKYLKMKAGDLYRL